MLVLVNAIAGLLFGLGLCDRRNGQPSQGVEFS